MLVDSTFFNVPDGATQNVFLGRPIEFIGAPSIARLLIVADVPGMSCTWLINVGGVQSVPIAPGATINVSNVAGAGPKEDEDQIATNVPLPAGCRNQLNVFNQATTGPTTGRYRATILP